MAEAEVLAQMVLCLPVAESMFLCPALAHQQPRWVGGCNFFCCADAHVLRWRLLPESETHVSHRLLFHRSTSFQKDLHLESCRSTSVMHITSRFQAFDQLKSRKREVLVLPINVQFTVIFLFGFNYIMCLVNKVLGCIEWKWVSQSFIAT